MYVIICILPNENGGYETNYFCGFAAIPNSNVQAIEWDVDKEYSKKFPSKYEAKQFVKRIETDEPLSIVKF